MGFEEMNPGVSFKMTKCIYPPNLRKRECDLSRVFLWRHKDGDHFTPSRKLFGDDGYQTAKIRI